MELTPSQAIVAINPARFRVLCCGRRWGKTTLAIDQMKARAYIKDSRIAYIAPTYQQARDIAWEQLKKDCKDAADSINESRLEIRLVNGSLIILRGWEAIETLRGQKFDMVVLDEIASMRNWNVNWNEVIRPTLTDTKGEALFISTPKGFNHFYDLFNMQDKDIDYKSFHYTSYDNTHLPVEELDKAKKELPEDQFAQEYLADFRKTQGLVYKEFSREKHVFSEDRLALQARASATATIVGIDWGYTNPCAILKAYKDRDSHYWFVEEYYKTNKMSEDIIEYAKSMGGTYYYADPAEADRMELLRRSGVNVRDVSKDVEAGIDSVRALFKTNRIHIHASCVNLITELEMYRYAEKKPDQNEPEAPVKENDHACDAMRYMLYMQAPVNLDLRAKIHTPNHTGGARRGYQLPKGM